jgi:hypothetical protein
MMFKTYTSINKRNNHLSSQLMEHEKKTTTSDFGNRSYDFKFKYGYVMQIKDYQ